MAKKAVAAASGSAQPVTEQNQLTLMVPLDMVEVDPEIAAREGDPDADKIAWFAESFIERLSANRVAQLQPVITLPKGENGKYKLKDGRHRFEGMKLAAEQTGESLELWVAPMASDSVQSLVEAIQANGIRVEPTVFDKAAGVERLIAAGMSQVEVAKVYNVSEGSISQWRKAGSVETKYKRAVIDGVIETDAAILIAFADEDEAKKAKLFDDAVRYRANFDKTLAALENRKAAEEAEAKIVEAREKADAIKQTAKELEAERKVQDAKMKEIEAAANKTKNVDELLDLRKNQEPIKAALADIDAKITDVTKEKETVAKEIEAAKAAKVALKEKAAVPGKVTAETVKTVAAESGAKLGKNTSTVSPRNRQQFKVELETMCKDADNPLPTEQAKIIGQMVGALQGYIDGEKSIGAIRNAFVLYCRNEAEVEKHKAAVKQAAEKEKADKAKAKGKGK